MKTKAMRTQKMTQKLVRSNINRLRNGKLNRNTQNRLKYWLFQQKKVSASFTKPKEVTNEQA